MELVRPEDFLVRADYIYDTFDHCIGIKSFRVFLHPDDLLGVGNDFESDDYKSMFQKIAAWAYNLGREKGNVN